MLWGFFILAFNLTLEKNMKVNLAILALFISTPLFADTTLFQCTTANDKELLVTMNSSSVSYKFGYTLTNPELSFTLPNTKVNYGVSNKPSNQYSVYSLDMPNGDTTYRIYSKYSEYSRQLDIDSGISVIKNGKELAHIPCMNKSYYDYVDSLDSNRLSYIFY